MKKLKNKIFEIRTHAFSGVFSLPLHLYNEDKRKQFFLGSQGEPPCLPSACIIAEAEFARDCYLCTCEVKEERSTWIPPVRSILNYMWEPCITGQGSFML